VADVQILAAGGHNAPLDYTLNNLTELIPKAVRAVFNGSGASSAFQPCLVIISASGDEVARIPSGTTVSAGGSAEVSWFPHVGAVAAGAFPVGGWVRKAVPLLDNTQAWETGGLGEPSVLYESGTFHMWYGGNSVNTAIGYANCSGDPALTANWHKFAGNPVIGQGGSGIAGFAARVNVERSAGVYQAFYSNIVGGGDLMRTHSTDKTTFAAPTIAIAQHAVPACQLGWANSAVWFDGVSWWMFVEGAIGPAPAPPWGMWAFKNTAIDNDGGWVVQNGGNPITSLIVPGYPRGYGQGPNIAEIDGVQTFVIGARDTLWYHIDKQSAGTDVTDITHGYTVDPGFVTWTPSDVIDLEHGTNTTEGTQVADPEVLQVSGTSYMFYSGVNTGSTHGTIDLAEFPGTLNQLLAIIG
jgi:hypothetical protein